MLAGGIGCHVKKKKKKNADPPPPAPHPWTLRSRQGVGQGSSGIETLYISSSVLGEEGGREWRGKRTLLGALLGRFRKHLGAIAPEPPRNYGPVSTWKALLW